METALAQLNYFPENKAGIELFTRKAKEEILSGVHDPIQVEIRLKVLEDIISEIRKDKDVKNALLNAASKYPEKTFKTHGVAITKVDRANYDYSNCNDSVYNELKSKETEIKEKIKAREEMLKAIIEPMANPENGEIINPAAKTYSYSLTIKLQ